MIRIADYGVARPGGGTVETGVKANAAEPLLSSFACRTLELRPCLACPPKLREAMRKSITLNIDPSRYRSTFFEGLEVTLHEWKGQFLPTIHKTHRPRDLRYNSINRMWRLDELLAILQTVESYGPLSPEKEKQNVGSFTLNEPTPVQFVKVDADRSGVFLHGWGFEPLYRLGEFEALSSVISVLHEVQEYVTRLRLPEAP